MEAVHYSFASTASDFSLKTKKENHQLKSSDMPHSGSPRFSPTSTSENTLQLLDVKNDDGIRASDHEIGVLPKTDRAITVDARDIGTPDDWVPRSTALTRLTGNHPFNAEPDMSQLYQLGFLAPISMHFVRNHGKVPKCQWGTHTLTVKGLVKQPKTFSMDDIVKLPSVTMPVQLSCAGNRRREVNMTKQTLGFNWGYGAHACSMWTGVRLSHILRICGIDMSVARYVHLVGSKLEGIPTGTFGTSIDITAAMNPWGDVLLAYKQNGELLTPDHGFPLRVITPGFIGGRNVKWVEEIEVSELPSQSYYHFHDNRILPSHVDAELAKEEDWLSRPEYLFNQAQINSAIAFPANGEQISISEKGTYLIKGFAFSGGGRKVTRVELSLDGGDNWEVCEVDYPEERYSHAPKYGKYYCWMHWQYRIETFKLLLVATCSGEIRCRAWDESNNTQPAKFSWNLMGMGNNSHYRVKLFPREVGSGIVLEFMHPTVAGSSPLGWMKPSVSPSKTLELRKTGQGIRKGEQKEYSLKEIAEHNTEDSVWVVIEGKVYDVTDYLQDHPGGAASILMDAGQDATEDFLEIHSDHAKAMLKKFYIGKLCGVDREATETQCSKECSEERLEARDFDQTEGKRAPIALSMQEWRKFEIIDKTRISQDTHLIKFKLQSPNHRLGLPVGYHMFTQGRIGGKSVVRAYTPVSPSDDLGTFTLLVKVYHARVHSEYPDGGKMSQYINALEVGDKLAAKEPAGCFEYKGRGKIVAKGKQMTVSQIGLICGGTGITPAYQIIQAIYKDDEDGTQVYLLYANKTEGDVLLKKELDSMATRENIHVWYTISAAAAGWRYDSGRINRAMIREHIPPASRESFVGICGPPKLISEVCIPNLKKEGYSTDRFVAF